MLTYPFLLSAQRVEIQHRFFAATERDMYKLYDQMMDSTRISNRYLDTRDNRFTIGFFEEINSRDTLMKFKQECYYIHDTIFFCERFYYSYISNCQPVAFYGRLMNYLKGIEKRENYFLKRESTKQLYYIRQILKKQYESGKLDQKEKAEALELMELATLRMINDGHSFKGYDQYMTDNIRRALVNMIDHPFYPAEYLDFYMSRQDTACVDTTGIPNEIKAKYVQWNGAYVSGNYDYDSRLRSFFAYKRRGEEWGGLSPGQAYLEAKRRWFPEKGYKPINTIKNRTSY